MLRAALPLIAWPTLQPKNPVRKNAEPTQNPARNQGLLTQDAPVGQTVPNKSSAQKVKSRVGKDSLVDRATKVFPGPSNGPNSFSKPLNVTTFPGDASPSERIPESAGTFAVPIPPITPGIPMSNNESKVNEEFWSENVETLTLLPEAEIQNSSPDNCGPNTIVIPTELCSSSQSMECSSSSETDSQKSKSTFRSPSARYQIVNRNKTIASLLSPEDDPEQLSYFDFTANDEEPPDFINYFQLDHVNPIVRPRLEEILRKLSSPKARNSAVQTSSIPYGSNQVKLPSRDLPSSSPVPMKRKWRPSFKPWSMMASLRNAHPPGQLPS